MSIAISRNEIHPIAPGMVLEDDNQTVVVVFGMAKRRGDNIVYSTKVTDALYTVLTKWKLELYTRRTEVKDGQFDWHAQRDAISIQSGKTVEYLGIAYNTRKAMSGEDYRKMIIDIGAALTGAAPVEGPASIMIDEILADDAPPESSTATES